MVSYTKFFLKKHNLIEIKKKKEDRLIDDFTYRILLLFYRFKCS